MDILRVKENGVWRDIPAIVGPEGPQGQTGPAGAPGQGVPSGGSAGDVLVKKTGTDYDTEWSGDLSDLKSAVTEIEDYLDDGTIPTPEQIPITFTVQKGGIDSSGNNYQNNNDNYKRIVEYIAVSDIASLQISPAEGETVYLAMYGSDYAFISRPTYTTAATPDISSASYIRLAGNMTGLTEGVFRSSFSITGVTIARMGYVEEIKETADDALDKAEDALEQIESIDPDMIDAIDDYLEDGTVPYTDVPTFTVSKGGIDSSGVNNHANDDAYKRTVEYIDISEISALNVNPSTDVTIYVALYNSEKTFISRDTYTESASQDLSGASYVRIAGHKSGGLTEETFRSSFTLVGIPGMQYINSHIVKTNAEPVATWVDDDAIVLNNDGLGIEVAVRPILEELGICCTFAAITPLNGNVTIDGNTMTKVEYFQHMQEKGCHVTAHPIHTYWYGTGYDIAKVNETLVQTLVYLQSNGFLHSDMLVYPGSSWNNADVVEVVRKWCECGVKPGYGTPNIAGDTTKWQIKRTFVNFEDYYDKHHNDTGFVSSMAWYKAQIDSAAANNGWIIFGTHSYQFSDSDDTSDPNANTRGNLAELMQYALTKGLKFRTLWDEYHRRENIYMLQE